MTKIIRARKAGYQILPDYNLRKVILICIADLEWKTREVVRVYAYQHVPMDYVARRLIRRGRKFEEDAPYTEEQFRTDLNWLVGNAISSLLADRLIEREFTKLKNGTRSYRLRISPKISHDSRFKLFMKKVKSKEHSGRLVLKTKPRKLSPSVIDEIRKAPEAYGIGRRLAKKFNVNPGLISRIRLGTAYK